MLCVGKAPSSLTREKRSSFTLPPDRNGHWEVDGGNLVLKEDEASAQQYALKRDFMMSLRSADVKKVSSSDEMLERLRAAAVELAAARRSLKPSTLPLDTLYYSTISEGG